jgi:hypothetical protein
MKVGVSKTKITPRVRFFRVAIARGLEPTNTIVVDRRLTGAIRVFGSGSAGHGTGAVVAIRPAHPLIRCHGQHMSQLSLLQPLARLAVIAVRRVGATQPKGAPASSALAIMRRANSRFHPESRLAIQGAQNPYNQSKTRLTSTTVVLRTF